VQILQERNRNKVYDLSIARQSAPLDERKRPVRQVLEPFGIGSGIPEKRH
jgi:hypothetical protein